MKKIKINKRILLIILIIVFIPLAFTISKYIIEESHNYFLNSKNFYFTSNRLKENNPLYLINNWSGVGTFTISFDLLNEKNSLVYTDYDIPYTIGLQCPNDVICTTPNMSGTIYAASQTHSNTIVVTVNPQRNFSENEEITVHISASSTTPYQKTISADFRYVVGKQGVTYTIEDEPNRPYILLKVTNAINYCTVIEAFGNYTVSTDINYRIYRELSATDKEKCVSQVITLNFNPAVLLIDTTDNLIDRSTYSTTTLQGVNYISNMQFNIAPLSTTVVKFYKVDKSQNYTYPIVNSTSIVGVTISDPI